MFESELNVFLKRHIALLRVLFCVIDLALLNISFQAAILIRFSKLFPFTERLNGAPPASYSDLELYMTFAWLIISLSMRLYVGRRGHPRHEEARDVLKALGFLATAILIFIVAQGGYNFYSRR